MLLVLLAIVPVGILFYLNRVRYYKNTIQLRTRLASDLHDQVGSYLTHIAISSDMLQVMPAGARQADYVNQNANNSRSAISTTNDVIWSIDSRSDSLGD